MCCVNHEALKIDAATFESGTYPIGSYDDGEERQIMANCLVCDSTISVSGPSIRKGTVRLRTQRSHLAWREILPEYRYQSAIRFPAHNEPEPCRCPMLVGGGIDHVPGCSRK